ncbi:segregation/condensation protein A [Anaerobacillus isosaccharinicus]|uniref:Segregation and condensation protein A n=1 Tax=Anaerobacillus isosaccharinicus TaxID=1532552 RepID=A0A1S2M4A2_9BACI|nr:segregation/condensation protein A [Anaerobacillus isosaccharinicus]MBA5585760.1 segregation/condensation protein A [Anaerobacillus isosaccharinicus]QOY35940.1 segregation/condensation protein A [Anaerobacillus isosaccharinicus]
MTQYNVKLDAFEGPLDLLLHLINKAEVDIYDIPVAKITDQYMNYIHTMQRLELDVASEYLVMAATLLAIKSKMLLPKHEDELFSENDEFIDEDDPREDLINRLIEYRRYKEAAETLKEREIDRGLIFSKMPSDLSPYIDEKKQEPQRINASLYDMLDAFDQLLKRKTLKIPKQTKIHREDFPLEKRMEEIIDKINLSNGKTSFFQLFDYEERGQIIVTFLAILELMKAKKIICEQEGNFTDISVSRWEESTFVG